MIKFVLLRNIATLGFTLPNSWFEQDNDRQNHTINRQYTKVFTFARFLFPNVTCNRVRPVSDLLKHTTFVCWISIIQFRYHNKLLSKKPPSPTKTKKRQKFTWTILLERLALIFDVTCIVKVFSILSSLKFRTMPVNTEKTDKWNIYNIFLRSFHVRDTSYHGDTLTCQT